MKVPYILHRFLNLNFIQVQFQELSYLYSSKTKIGIRAIADTLDDLGVDYVVADVAKRNFEKLPKSFLCTVCQASVHFIALVKKKTDSETLSVLVENSKLEEVTIDDFLNRWSGLVILVDERKNNRLKFFLQKNYSYLLFGFVFLVFLAVIGQYFKGLEILYFFITIVGIYLCYSAFQKQSNPFYDSLFCQQNQNNCQKVLNSRQSRIFYDVNFSDLALIYFLTCSILFLIEFNSSSHLYFALLGIPIIVYSVFLQVYKLKSFCPLCLAILCIFLLQLVVLFILNEEFELHLFSLQLLLPLFIFIFLSWKEAKQIFIRAYKLKHTQLLLTSFKKNKQYFEFIYDSWPKLVPIDTNYSLKLKKGDEPILLSLIISPFCNSCHEVFYWFKKITRENNFQGSVDLILFAPEIFRDKDKYLVIDALVKVHQEQNIEIFIDAFETCIQNQNGLLDWLDKWGNDSIEQKRKIEGQHHWCSMNSLNKTPLVGINQRLVPTEYNVNEIEFYLETFSEY